MTSIHDARTREHKMFSSVRPFVHALFFTICSSDIYVSSLAGGRIFSILSILVSNTSFLSLQGFPELSTFSSRIYEQALNYSYRSRALVPILTYFHPDTTIGKTEKGEKRIKIHPY